jgi:hypothetical protein
VGLVEKRQLLTQLSPPLDHLLATQLIDEFISLERRFIQRDWEPTELDGGQFSEILSRIVYHQDSGNLDRTRNLEDCARYISNDTVPHSISPRHTAIHLIRVLQTVYKFRSQRGAVHISPTYTPNHMDARLIVENVRWCMNETLRIFWNGDRQSVAKTIRELLQFDVPCIGLFEDVVLVQRTDLSPEEEILVLLHYGGELGLSRTELGLYAGCSPAAVTKSLQKLESPTRRQIIKLGTGKFRLTDLGSKRIREQLSDKLLLQ